MTVDETLEQRAQTYGPFKDNAANAQALKSLMRTMRCWGSLGFDQCEALEMIASKISRILSGDPDHVDSWRDIEGYARLVRERLEGKVR
jgi:hypothetical protein